MFSLVTGLYDSYLAPSELTLLVVGAPGVGKTALLERLKVTQIPKRPSNPPLLSAEDLSSVLQKEFLKGGAVNDHVPANKDSPVKELPKKMVTPSPVVVTQQRRRLFNVICPAPERYRQTTEDDDEEFVMDDDLDDLPLDDDKDKGQQNEPPMEDFSMPLEAPGSPVAPRRVRCHSKEMNVNNIDLSDDRGDGSMEDIPIEDAAPQKPSRPKGRARQNGASRNGAGAMSTIRLQQSSFAECNMKPNAKMLPMSKIRPTIGTNLGKIDMYGAKCNIFDVGGKMRNLWERYYEDCDAVVFCWKLGEDPDEVNGDAGDSDSDEEPFDLSQQQEILNEVRAAIPDDVPFLILGHVFGNVKMELVGKRYSTNLLMPRYHNPMTGLMCSSAKTGAGLVSAMEWLIPLAKRQQKERIAARKKAEEKQV
mmetsp:Transcript_50047/g.76104  ORF Transcript_50047/g.76104 Transcript_50047/m.76104 type:complete len:421 (-) Transcript_50047:47-1309(-)